MAEDVKKQIIAWFNSPQDYDQGLELLRKVFRRHKMLGKMIRRGETRNTFEKLVYELNKVAGLKKIPVPRAKVEKKIVVPALPPLFPDKVEETKKEEVKEKSSGSMNLAGKDTGSLSEAMRRVVKENSSLCMQRGKKHRALSDLPEDNSEETLGKRVKLMGEIQEMTKRIEVLFVAWQAHEKTGAEPDVKVLWPEENKTDGDTGNVSGSGDKEVSVEDLKILKKNLQSSVTKDRNLLLYGSKTKPKDGKQNPVPDGPKRKRLEKRIGQKEQEIKAIDLKIVELE